MHQQTKLVSHWTRTKHAVSALAILIGLVTATHAATVTPSGYTNTFDAQPGTADFSTLSLGSSSGAIASPAQMDSAVQGLTAAGIATTLGIAANDPPGDAMGAATWLPNSKYIQTRPTGNDATFLMCTLTNGMGVNASSVTITYTFNKNLAVTEEVDGVRAYYSVTGAAGSWTPIPELSLANAASASVTLNFIWQNGGPLYIVWGDDNGTGTPDTIFSFDNFSASAVPASQVPVSITNQPLSQIVAELAPVTFSVGIAGYPPPTLQWYTNDIAIPNATNSSYSITSAPAAYNGLQFKAIAQNNVSNVNYAATSTVATLTVNADTISPTLIRALAAGLNQVIASFSERVTAATATNIANYSITSGPTSLTISNIVLDSSQTNITFTVSAMTPGTTYTLTANGITDISATANLIAPGSQIQFDAAAIASVDIGAPSTPSFIASAGNGYNVTGIGTNIGGTGDQFTLAYQQVGGDFDVKVRLAAFSSGNPWAQAGLMARETLAPDSRFAASIAMPNVGGCGFYYRSTTPGAAANTGAFPVNYPYTWLRLTRAGDVFTGYASFDGQNWVSLGSVTIPMGPAVYFGLATSSGSASQTAVVQFRDQQTGAGGTVIPSPAFTREPLSAASRRTGLVISEIMYHPKARTDGKQLEYIEIYNSMSIFDDMSGYRLTGDVDFTFPNGTIIQPGQFIVLAKVAADVSSVYGLSGVMQYGTTNYLTNIVGNVTNVTVILETNVVDGVTNVRPGIVNSLNNGGGTVRLRSKAGAVLLEVTYETRAPWPIEADGTGHSLVLARASYGQGSPSAWAASDLMGGSPGTYDSLGSEPAQNVVINEFLAHTDPPQEDAIELYNHGTTPVDISGFWLSDDLSTNKFRIPDGTVLPARGFISFTCVSGIFNSTNTGFALSGSGEQIVLVNSNKTRVIDALRYDGQENGVSMGRYPDGAPAFHRLAALTLGTTNAPPRFEPIAINEIMFNPISGNGNDEFVEIYNRGSNAVNIGDWRFVNGIDFTFPKNTIMGPGDYLVVAKSVARLRTNYANLNLTNCLGNFSGSLANGGERLSLAAPDYETRTNNLIVTTNVSFRFIVNDVNYEKGGKWGYWSDGGGSSLELIDARADNSQPRNWADSDESTKGTWTSFEWTGPIDNPLAPPGPAAVGDTLQVMMLGVGECMLDDLEVRANIGPNLLINGNFESALAGTWVLQGSHDTSFTENGGFTGKGLHIRAGSRGDNGVNRIRSIAFTSLTTGNCTLRGKVRWIRGFPEVLLRLRGGVLEAFGRMPVPVNLGTPGARNSRAITNAGPAIYDVVHTPALPQANEAVRITARVTDPDGVSQLAVRYRIASSPTAFTTLPMVDNGTGSDAVAGDGLFTATINGLASGTLMGFHVVAVDVANVTNLFPANALNYAFPNDAPTHECVIRWGDVQMPGSFASYHLWFTDWSPDGTRQRWEARDRLNNAQLDGTFVYNNYRVIYNAKPQYGGSPWHVGSMNGPLNTGTRVDFVVNFPEDDVLLGQTDFILNTVGNPSGNTSSDTSGMAEQTSYEIFRGMGIHYNYRRYVHVFLNGQQRSITGNLTGNFIMEDSQQPNGDMINEWFPDDSDGQLYKIEDWFEFTDDGGNAGQHTNDDADLQRRNTLIGGTNVVKLAPYRFMWRKRSLSASDSANDYTNLVALIDIISPASNPSVSPIPDNVVRQFDMVADIEQWMRIFAVQHAVGNWDSYGYRRGKNAYTYRPVHGKFAQLTWDIDFTMGVGGDGTGQTLFDTSDQRIAAMNDTPETVRAYWRSLQDIINGPLNNSYLDPRIDARAAAFRANNITYDPNTITTIKNYILGRRNTIAGQIPAASFTVANTSFSSSSNIVTITGTAPIDVKFVEIDGIRYPITWSGTRTAPTGWSLRLPLGFSGTTNYALQAFDRLTNAIPGTTRTLTINFSGQVEAPETNIVINEIMFNSLVPSADYIELFNRSAGFTFDVSGWRINGLDYTFPEGSYIGPRSFLVLTKDRIQFANVYGGAVQVFDQYPGSFQNDGETISLTKPGPNGTEIIIDKVRYDNSAPWPGGADGTGSSLQVVDLTQDNSRVGNWIVRYNSPVYTAPISTPAQTNEGWRFVSATITGNYPASARLLVYPDNLGTLWLDDFSYVSGATAAVGSNYSRGGDFEDTGMFTTTNTWDLGTNMNLSYITNDAVRPGGGLRSFRMVSQYPGSASVLAKDIIHYIAPMPPNGQSTLSFWYFATNTTFQNLTVRIVGTTLNFSTNISMLVNPSNYVPPQLIVAATNFATPGATNTSATNLPAFQTLWINELQADNTTGIADNFGEREPWIELYNASTNPVSLDGLYLSTNYASLRDYALPPGITLAPREFRVIWCDGQPGQDSGTNVHTSFRLASPSGSVALSRIYNGATQVLDYVNYSGVHANRSYGSFPDGQPFDRQEFYYVTGRGTNNGASAPLTVFINEWMASNTNALSDPADGNFNDWFEIYNPGNAPVDLEGYYLTDSGTNAAGVVTNKFQFKITTNMAHIIPAHGHLLVWADNEPNQNLAGTVPRPDMHVNFALAKGGEALGLFAADGTQVDWVKFGAQLDDVSEGRCPDGSSNIRKFDGAPYLPSPRLANVGCGGANSAPLLDPVDPVTVFLGETAYFTAQATDAEAPPQTLTYTLEPGAPPSATIGGSSGFFSWTPANVGTNNVIVRVTDSGTPPLSGTVTVAIWVQSKPTFASIVRNGNELTLAWPTVSGRTYKIVYKDSIDEAQWHDLGQPLEATSSSLSVTYDLTSPPRRFYKLVTLP